MTGMSHSIQGRPTIQHVLNMNAYCGAVESVLLQILCFHGLSPFADYFLLQILCCCGVILLQILRCSDWVLLQRRCCCRFCFHGLSAFSPRFFVVALSVVKSWCCSRVVVVAKYVSLQIRCCWRRCLLAHSPNRRLLVATLLSHTVHLQI